MRSAGRFLVVVMLLLALSTADAQVAGIDSTVAVDTTIVAAAVDTIGWRLGPRFRGMHFVLLKAPTSDTYGISVDADILIDRRSRPPLSLGIRIAYEWGESTNMLDWGYRFETAALLGRFSIGGRSAELTVYGGYAWIGEHSGGWNIGPLYDEWILPTVGVEIRWLIVPKYAGLVLRYTTSSNRFLMPPVPSEGERNYSLETGGIGLIIGLEP